MEFQLTINMDNDAFLDENGDVSYSHEIARLLRELADKVERHALIDFEVTVRDSNGNVVGKAKVISD